MIKITPLQFLETIFFDVPPDESVLVAHPIHRGAYKGRFKQLRPTHKAFQKFSKGQTPPVDWYFGISTVDNNSNTTLKRRKQDMRAVYCVVLDDIGTKCEVPPVAPSWVLETSKGNYQYGYMLTTPVDNMQWFELFMAEVGKLGFADKGTLDSTRIMRVPLSKNVKDGRDGWLSTLTVWNPELCYDLPDLAKLFDIKLPPESKVSRVSYVSSVYSDIDLPEVTDPVFVWLQEQGFVRGKQGNGYFDIKCPWHKEHSDGRDEAGYKPLGLGDDPEYRTFKCHHSHDQGTPDFLDWVHEESGLEVGSCDRNAIEQALTLLANSVGVEVKKVKEKKADETTVETETIEYDFGVPLPHDLFNHKIMVGQGKNARVCPTCTVDNISQIINCHGMRRVCDLISRKSYMLVGGKKVPLEYALGQIRSQAIVSEFSNFSGFADVCNAALSRCTDDINPVADYLKGLHWDGQGRINEFTKLIDTEHEAVRNLTIPAWLAQCVAFAFGENAGGGSVLVLAGRGGIGKTALLQTLVPEHLREYMKTGIIMSPNNKDDVAKACSAWITELGEMDGTFRRSDMAALKAFLTDEYDNYRPPYGREVLEFKRMTSFAATVNDSLFLSDMTGGGYRRFWVVESDEIRWNHDIDIDQLWAEVVYKYQSGELSRRLSAEESEVVERAAVNAALYNDDLIVEDFKRLWPDLSISAYNSMGSMTSRVGERDIIAMLPSPEIAGASEIEMRKHMGRLRAFLKDNTPKGKKIRFNDRLSRALVSSGGKHLWALPVPVAQVVGGSNSGHQ